MKKYTLRDSFGNKKTIYAENLSHAIKLLNDSKTADSKITDTVYSAEHYIDTNPIESFLTSALLNEVEDDSSFNTALKKYDTFEEQILAIVKDAFKKGKKYMLDWKRNYL